MLRGPDDVASEATSDALDRAQECERDKELMSRIHAGDQQAYGELVTRFLPPLNQFARRMVRGSHDAEDLIQETLLRVWKNADRWQPERGKLTTWVHRIMHNLCIDHYRRDRSDNVEDLGEQLQSTSTPDAETEAADQATEIHLALGQLPERQKSAIVLCHYQGFSNRDAAEVIGVSVDALESLMARGRRTLRQQLNHLSKMTPKV